MPRALSLAPPPPLAQPARRQRVLAVVHPRRLVAACWALLRAREVARRRDAELHVLCVLSRPRGKGDRPLEGILGVLDRRYGAESPRIGRRMVRVGHTTQLAAQIARDIGADVIVAGAERGSGGHWARVARRTELPVLVARPRDGRRAIIAATDFSDERVPTFESALQYGTTSRSGARVLLLHNVDPRGRVFTRGFGVILGDKAVRQLRDARAERIHQIVDRAKANADSIVTTNHDPANAIAEHACRRGSDLVIVGAHAGSPLRLGPHGRTANRVVELVGGSALIVPLPARGLVA